MSAIDPRLLRHYNRELGYLRRRAVEFAEDHRQVAGRLGIDAPTDPDPHVERLLEGVAYLNARVQLKLDDQFPAFTQYLLDALYPHYLAPTPAMAIMEYKPRDGDEGLQVGITHPRGSEIRASLDGDSHAPVEFRTGFDVTLWPFKIAAVEYLPTRAAVAAATGAAVGAAGLRIRIAVTAPVALASLALDTLPLFIDGGQDVPNLLYQQLLSECVGVRICAPDRGRRDAWVEEAGAVEPMGFAADEALLPGEARSFRGYRLLCEYFAMPEKFRFVKLTGLRAGFARGDKEIDIVLLFNRPVEALVGAVSVDTVKLFTTPVINLFERRFDRVLVDRKRDEHLVIPDRVGQLDYEVYRLDSVTGYAKGDAQGAPALPLYARRAQRGVRPLFYALRRRLRRLSEAETRRRRESDYIGTETWISLSSPESPALAQGIVELGVRGLVTNRALASRLRPGAANLKLALISAEGAESIRITRGPTRPQPPLGLGDAAWRIVSHLAPGHHGFVSGDGAPDLLADHLSLYLRDEAPALRREIQGIVGLHAETVTRRASGQSRLAFQRGQKLILTLAAGSYEAGSAYLFTSVIARFLAEFATINSFTECEVRTDTGLSWGWGTCSGQRPTI
jgi:type VI secretion system protein ImpG